MKKTLALVLALVMVLALVPAAFAKTITVGADDKYTAKVYVTGKADYQSVENATGWTLSDDDEALVPSVTVSAPYKALQETAGTGLWDGNYIPVDFEVDGFYDGLWSCTDLKATVNGKEDGVTVDTANKVVKFTMNNLSSANATYSFEVVLKGKTGDDTMVETMKVKFTFIDATKPVKELKFGAASEAMLRDGVYFVDRPYDYANNTWPTSTEVEVLKNDGSKFDEIFYWSEAEGDYIAASTANKVNKGTSKIVLPLSADGDDDVDTYYVTVETQYAIYRGKITFKYRSNVARVDPKGIAFEKDTYTIGVNEVLVPKFKTIVPVYHDVADYIILDLTANSEKSVIDVDNTKGPKITGIREGVAYVVAYYYDSFVPANGGTYNVNYSDTAKIIVEGTYDVKPEGNYIVNTKSGALNVRAAASTSAAKIGSIPKGSRVNVVEIKDGWAKIILPPYTNAYVSAAYLVKEGMAPVPPIVGTRTVICRVLNVRAGAGTTYKIVGKLTRNTKVEVLETVAAGKWAKINYNGATAYICTTYIQ